MFSVQIVTMVKTKLICYSINYNRMVSTLAEVSQENWKKEYKMISYTFLHFVIYFHFAIVFVKCAYKNNDN